ncbi:BTAD domain-containing putative transcriptional regulator [Rubrivivax sp. RP6-9]|uniref:BTAD domain-containing putative transcriptional regulator n=1 Tax=Rubrivivax sp. RP6-9 TaxID=3415750 RepID=UPI003CC5FA1F
MSAAAAIVVGPRMQVLPHGAVPFDATGKAALLLALAALEGTAERRRAALLLWPDSPERQARNNLRTLVHRLNQRCGVELLLGTEQLGFDPARARVVTQDTEVLLAALDAGGPQACELLAQAGVDGHGSEALGAWLDAARQRWRRQQLAALSEALHAALTAGEAARAMTLARACVQLEPLSEHWHRQLMDTLARCGDRAAALAAYEDCKQRLRQHLGVLPDLQTRTVHLRLLQVQARAQAQAQPLAAVNTGLTPLGGAARFALVEREAVLAEAQAAMARGQHVVLQGEAGVGKTRLLRHLAEVGVVEPVVLRPGARDEPYAAVAQLLQEVQPRRAPRIGMPEQVELARLAPLAFPEVQPSQSGLSAPRLHAALRHWAARLAEAGVQRLVLDDLHHADAASQAAFAALLAPHDDSAAPVLPLLLAHRAGEIEAPLAEALVAAQVHDQARCITLQRLSLHGVRALLRAMQAGNDDALAARLLQRTGGNPLFVIELARQLQDAPESDAANAATAATTDNLNALLRSRLQGCSSDAQQLASVAAVAGQDFSVELASAVIGQPPLALMDAWNELQQRGLFADHGTAHELVRDAALAMLPQAIGRTLHRQVAAFLEAQSQVGQRVLVHWLAADEHDRALPHAVHQLHAAQLAGLSTVQLEVELLDLLARLSDTVLQRALWLSAEVDGEVREEMVLRQHAPRLAALVARVEQLPQTGTVAQWLAFERARLLHFRDQQTARAYAELSAVAERMDERGIERAWVEVFLGNAAFSLNGAMLAHSLRAQAAMAGLPRTAERARLLRYIDMQCAFRPDIAGLLRAKLAVLRAARRRHDHGAVDAVRHEIALQCGVRGLVNSSYRQLRIDAHMRLPDERLRAYSGEQLIYGVAALNAGRYAAALRFLQLQGPPGRQASCGLFRTLVWINLGQWRRACEELQAVDLKELEQDLVYQSVYAIARSRIDSHAGVDALPALRQLLARTRELGVDGINLQLLEWEIARSHADASDAVALGEHMLAGMRRSQAAARRRTPVLIDLAELHARAGSTAARTLALEAAHELRRGRTISTLYLPEGLVRCATLLRRSDPAEAATLLHVARRWLRQALPHVPDFARQSFVEEVQVNRLLLDDPAQPR